jgi:hypothetical protein
LVVGKAKNVGDAARQRGFLTQLTGKRHRARMVVYSFPIPKTKSAAENQLFLYLFAGYFSLNFVVEKSRENPSKNQTKRC